MQCIFLSCICIGDLIELATEQMFCTAINIHIYTFCFTECHLILRSIAESGKKEIMTFFVQTHVLTVRNAVCVRIFPEIYMNFLADNSEG